MDHDDLTQACNQAKPLIDYNAYLSDPLLQQQAEHYRASPISTLAEELGKEVTSEAWQRTVLDANRYPPELQRFDRYGHKINQVHFNPAYHHLMQRGKLYRLHSLAWDASLPSPQVARAVLYYLYAQMDQGPTCPLTMTYAAIPVLQQHADRYTDTLSQLLNDQYDPRFLPIPEKTGLTLGMAMTEKQGGSDLRANITTATTEEDHFRLNGHKWFCSAPMSDAFLMLAQLDGALSCFFVPRFCPDGSQNTIDIQRLKNKLGNHSNASSEIELHNTYAELLGEPGQGVRTIIQMVNHTRFDCALGSSAHMRQALVQAIHHCQQRSAFGQPLIEQPLMQNVLADACLESNASLLLSMRLAHALDKMHQGDKAAAKFVRLGTAIAKYWVCKRAPWLVNEMSECLGGAGYVEEFPMARLYRDAPLNSIWEGSGNIQCLDVLRAIASDSDCLAVVLSEIEKGLDKAAVEKLKQQLHTLLNSKGAESQARRITEQLALGLQTSLMQQHLGDDHAHAFASTRCSQQASHCLGQLPSMVNSRLIIERTFCP